jgi:hypothetical protein
MQKYKRDNLTKTIQHGDIVFVRTENFIGKIIRWVTSSNINHVAFYIGNGLIIESTLGHGVRIIPLDIYLNNIDNEIYLGRLKEKFDPWKVILYSYNFYGIKYDVLGQVGILLRFMVQKVGLQKLVTFLGKNKINHSGFWCSEFLGLLFQFISIEFHDMDISYLSPADIHNSDKIQKIDF